MVRTEESTRPVMRGRLSRDLVLEAALDYAGRHGLDGLSMHKLGAELDVKAMSLYNHVANKDDLLAGLVDLLWSKVALPPQDVASWPDLVRTLAVSLREVIHTHASVAPLLTASQSLSPHALRVAEAYRAALSRAGLPDTCAVGFLRTVVGYALGQSLAELGWSRAIPADEGADELARIRQVTDLLPPSATDAEIRTALWFCADCDMTEQFTLGIDLMIKGLAAALAEDDAPCAVASSSRPGR